MTKVAIVMPAWNEAEGLPGFIKELNDALDKWSPVFVVVDDCSTDGTASAALSLAQSGIAVSVHTNECNTGHGPSTVQALNLGLAAGVDFVVAVDGDGQFLGEDVNRVMETLATSGVDVVEGVRTGRNDPAYRLLVSLATRLLVALRAHALPADANTPLRAYRAEALANILTATPAQAATPNLIFSVLCRQWRLQVAEVAVRSVPRRSSNPVGSTWGRARKRLPSRRFVAFSLNAVWEWTTLSLPREPMGRVGCLCGRP